MPNLLNRANPGMELALTLNFNSSKNLKCKNILKITFLNKPEILNSRTRRKEGNYFAAVEAASQVISFRSSCYEAYWARAKARRELNELTGALADLREAIKLSPKNMELHRFTMQVKSEIESRPNNNNVVVIHSSQDPSSPAGTSGGYMNSFPGLSSTPKKELESEV